MTRPRSRSLSASIYKNGGPCIPLFDSGEIRIASSTTFPLATTSLNYEGCRDPICRSVEKGTTA